MSKTTAFSIRLSPEVRVKLEAFAKEKGVPEADLVRGWIAERLSAERPLAALLREELARASAVVIAALSSEHDHEAAKDIVAEHIIACTGGESC